MAPPFFADLPCRLCIPKKRASIFAASADAEAIQAEVHSLVDRFIPAELEPAAVEIVGHQSGVPRQYPHSPEKIRRQVRTAYPVLPTVDTMRFAFETMGLDAIEMDAQVVDDDDGGGGEVYVMHDRPTAADMADEVVAAYLAGNTLALVLEAFVAAGYHQQGQKIYLELKTQPPMGELADTDESLVERTAGIIDEVALSRGPESEQFRSQIGFVSFNDRALKRASDLAASGHSFHFVAGTNRPICSLLAGMIDETRLDRATIERLQSSSWLTGIWFGPGWVPDYGTVFPTIDAAWDRKLSYGLGTYYTSATRLRRLMRQEGNRHLNGRITSVITELASSTPVTGAQCRHR